MKSASLQYANAMADIALAQGAAEPVAKQLHDFGAAYAQSAELRTFLASPAVSVEAKHAVIENLMARLGASKIVRNFLFVIADHRRTHLIPEVIRVSSGHPAAAGSCRSGGFFRRRIERGAKERDGGNAGAADGQEDGNKVRARSGVIGRRGRADRGHHLRRFVAQPLE